MHQYLFKTLGRVSAKTAKSIALLSHKILLWPSIKKVSDTGWPIGPGGEAAPYPDISDNMDMFGVRCLILYESRCKWSICRPNAKQR